MLPEKVNRQQHRMTRTTAIKNDKARTGTITAALHLRATHRQNSQQLVRSRAAYNIHTHSADVRTAICQLGAVTTLRITAFHDCSSIARTTSQVYQDFTDFEVTLK